MFKIVGAIVSVLLLTAGCTSNMQKQKIGATDTQTLPIMDNTTPVQPKRTLATNTCSAKVSTQYVNSYYGFSIALDEAWQGYTVSETRSTIIGQTTVIELYIPRLDPADNKVRYFGGILIYILTQGNEARQWVHSADASNAHITYLAANSRYIFGYQPSTDPPPALEFPTCEIDKVTKSFSLQ